jgi:PAS domain S-box-containing protein
MTLLGAGVFLAPRLAAPLWAVIGLVGAAAIGYGAARHAPAGRVSWWLLAGAVLAMTLGDTLYALAGAGDGVTGALADVSYLAMFPLLGIGLVRMTRATVVLTDRTRMLDLMTFACAAGLAAWVTVISPAIVSTRLNGVEKPLLAAYALGDTLLLIAMVRLAVAARRSWSVALLLTGACGLLVGDAAYALSQLGGGWRPGQPAELGYLVFYAAWGAAALHPSMTVLTQPVDAWPTRLPGRHAALLAGSLAVPPALLIGQALTGGVRDALMIGVTSLMMLFVVVIRLGDALGRYRNGLVRERALREASGALVGAADAAQVRAAARSAVAALLPAGQRYEVVTVAPHDGWLPPVPAERRTRLIDLALIDPAVRDRLAATGGDGDEAADGELDAALVCPLEPSGGPGGRSVALVVAGPRAALATTRNAIEVLASQVALALDRIWLTEAMGRSDTDRYLRAVVANAAEAVLIVEPSGEIRYASPSLATVVDLDPSALPTLRELVAATDRDRLEDTLRRAGADGARDVWTLRGADGGRATVEVRCRDLRADRMVRGYVITLRDVTQQRRAERDLIRQTLEATPAGQNRHSSATKFRLPS